MGRISEDNFNQMMAKTQKEQAELKQQAARQRRELAGEMQEASDARQWTEAIKACANLTELDAITLNRLVKEIIVHEWIDEEGTRHISGVSPKFCVKSNECRNRAKFICRRQRLDRLPPMSTT